MKKRTDNRGTLQNRADRARFPEMFAAAARHRASGQDAYSIHDDAEDIDHPGLEERAKGVARGKT